MNPTLGGMNPAPHFFFRGLRQSGLLSLADAGLLGLRLELGRLLRFVHAGLCFGLPLLAALGFHLLPLAARELSLTLLE
ncbi:MAG TPA: hypothetical protein VEO74_06625 [Thermoanaerobaculia bacterium]|nr:hypothetical protein [Thermoanaerobaculia bacterium]